VSLLKQDFEAKPESVTLLQQIDTSIERLDNVVTNILQFSADKKLSFAPVNLHSIIHEQLLSFPRTDSNTAFFELDLAATPFMVGCDTAIRQIIYNLILNALQATKYKGQIYISTKDIEKKQLNGSCIELSIKDNGPGIDSKLLETLFEPFVTSKNEGTGLGLSIVKQLVLQHMGIIEASNNCDGVDSNETGATFTITFPRRRDS
jgi:two-component system sensor histidine kinase AtoS